jgi:hypothetical protein
VDGNPIYGTDPTGHFDVIGTLLIGFGRLSFETANLATRYAPQISAATTFAGVVWIVSGIQLALQETGFLPTNDYTPYVFAISGALFMAGQSLQALNRNTVSITTPLRNSSGEIISGGEANSRAIASNPSYANNPPYAPTIAAQGTIAANTPLVRVFNPTASTNASGMQGGWVMPRADVVGLTAPQLQQRFALPNPPTQICDVNAAGLPARVGIAGPNFGGPGGGTQVQLLARGATFTNPRPINGAAQ